MKYLKFFILFFILFLTACSFNPLKNTQNSNVAKPVRLSTENPEQPPSNHNIAEEVKNYILNDQENKSEAQKVKWSKTFLNEVDIENLYTQYIDNKGNTDDLESFATYMTLNAPILSNWKDLFEKDLYETYGEKVSRLEHLEDDLYEAYIIKDGTEIPYVVVSSRTGYFHG